MAKPILRLTEKAKPILRLTPKMYQTKPVNLKNVAKRGSKSKYA